MSQSSLHFNTARLDDRHSSIKIIHFYTSKSPIFVLVYILYSHLSFCANQSSLGRIRLDLSDVIVGFFIVTLGCVSTIRVFCFTGGVVSVKLFEEKSCLVTLDQRKCGSAFILLALSLLDETKLYIVEQTFRNRLFCGRKWSSSGEPG